MGNIDDLLIERVWSPAAGWLQHRLGAGPWRVAIECLNGSIAFYVAAVALQIAGMGPEDGIFVTLLRTLAWLLVMDWLRRHAYRQAASSVGVRTARAREWMFRLTLLLMLPLSFAYADQWHNMLYSGSMLLLVCHLYFKASDTPPPREKRGLAWTRA